MAWDEGAWILRDAAGGEIVPFPLPRAPHPQPVQVAFERAELMRILDLYGRMVAGGEWRGYAIVGGLAAVAGLVIIVTSSRNH